MYKLKTEISNYRFNSSLQKTSIIITWFVLEEDIKMVDKVRCFTNQELQDFLDFVTKNPYNFPGNKNYHSCNEDENLPFCPYSMSMKSKTTYPKKLILRTNTQISNTPKISDCMDIILVDIKGKDISYNLEFGVIGELEIKY